MLTPMVSVILNENLQSDGRTYSAGGKYTMDKALVQRLRRQRPGCLRVVYDNTDPPQRDKMVYGEGIRHS